jgi:hypothetical protein
MTLLLSAESLAARREALSAPEALGGLAASLQRELYAALTVPVPEGKARLTRHGGRCVHCTVLLAFDPAQPQAHACPACGVVYTDQVHHDWWLMNAHLWTAEQCTRAAALAALCDDERAAARADEILAAYADRYLGWPNRDNALGPTRPFFSTYLESIWLLHLGVALDLREQSAHHMPRGLGGVVRETLIAPSAHLIASFPEGRSNREVWHCAARLAAAGLLGDDALRDRAADSLRHLLRTGLHTDGSWYEGENYHLFAHRGLLSAVTLAERAGLEIEPELGRRFAAGFASPFRTMFPDGTFPARRDSQYGISLRQYRTADWLECGLARCDTPALRAALAMIYDPTAPVGDTGRAFSTADAERNQRGVRLTRADGSWRALLLARLDLPPLDDATPQSELLEGQGIAVFRRDAGRVWVGLDYGDPGAGHGHPDRLNLVIATPTHRWLDDVGTGSYTAPSLAWYRSALAHNAPMVNGLDQGTASGTLLAHDEQGETGWVSATFTDPVSGVRFVRTTVVLSDHLIDEITWVSATDVGVDLPLQAALRADHSGGVWRPTTITATSSDFLSAAQRRPIRPGNVTSLVCAALPSPAIAVGDIPAMFDLHLWSDTPAELWSAVTIGPPAGNPHGMVALRQRGQQGRSVRLVAAAGTALELVVDDQTVVVRHPDGHVTTHQRADHSWTVRSAAGIVTLRGARTMAPRPLEPPVSPIVPTVLTVGESGSVAIALGATHYRGTEATWHESGEPTGMLWISHDASKRWLTVTIEARLGRPPAFAPPCHENPLDNELPDVNSDGVQLHWRGTDGVWNGVLAVPEGDGVRLSVVAGTRDDLTAHWSPRAAGFQITFRLDWPDPDRDFEFDCCVNERPLGRERRRGQLVLSGANGESGYLRGARQGPERAITLRFQHPSS